MNFKIPSIPDVGYCTVYFEHNDKGFTRLATVTCPVNLAEDIYCAIDRELNLAEDLTGDNLKEIVASTLSDMFGKQIKILERLH